MRRSAQAQSNRILDAAAEAFAADGFAGARVDAIAKAAGVNKRMLYHYVGDKAELFRAVLEREAQRLTDESLTDPGIWRLVLEEAAQAGDRGLLAALAARVSPNGSALAARVSPNGSRVSSSGPRVSSTESRVSSSGSYALLTPRMRLAAAMFDALLPDFAAPEPAEGGAEGGTEERSSKPRIRMQPRLVAAQAAERRDSKRSK